MSFKNEDRPELRWPLEVKRQEFQGQEVVILICPLGISVEPAVFPASVMPIIARFDGKHSIAEIVDEGQSYGVTLELVCQIARDLKNLMFLKTLETVSRWRQIQDEFNTAKTRPAALADSAYPSDLNALKQEIRGYLMRSNHKPFELEADREISAIMSPHIDYRRGWSGYAASYTALEKASKPDILVIFGTSHNYGDKLFRLTNKNFESPFGEFRVARSVLNALENMLSPEVIYHDEYAHKTEHSIELQLPFLGYRYEGDLPEILPVLVGSFHSYVTTKKVPPDNSEAGLFIRSLAEVLNEVRKSGKSVLFYAGVDFAHVGMHFGDQIRICDSGLSEVEKRDKEMLKAVLGSDSKQLFEHIVEDFDKRRICGFPSLYTMMEVMKALGMDCHGHYLDYSQAVDQASDTVVTFASGCWTHLKGVLKN